ncbi:MAG: metallophosphoesterase [Ilumatobacteraceae bacterium]
MKIAVCSDLHMEFRPITLENPEGAEVLILGGDILVENDLDEYNLPQIESGFARRKSTMYHTFFEEVCAAFPHVLYIAGNHEHYHGDYKFTNSELKKKLARYENLHVLDKEVFKLREYTFVGSTLWTDMNKEDPLTLYHIKSMMNDFRVVKNSNRSVYRNVPIYEYDELGKVKYDENYKPIQIGMKKREETAKFSPEDALEEHKKCLEYIKFVVSEAKPDEKVVVVGHHSPSMQSCVEMYRHDTLMNGGYHSSLDEYIMDHPQIVLWTHGHTHENLDYIIGDTRIVCNPRGYAGHDLCADTFELKVIEV